MYDIWFSQKAKKQLKKLPRNAKGIVLKKLYSIRYEPFRYVKKLEGSKLWRLRISDYRAIIDIVILNKKIFVLKIDKRSKVYD
ncbi:type II toxin-antitoxin system RelE/ParE family toxin [Candidatus Woesearchaeota archaeon]|nr:type II toxin-antitoxin system RelE/ParE family toxin [Candidatus Woesearchaeota archaeon]